MLYMFSKIASLVCVMRQGSYCRWTFPRSLLPSYCNIFSNKLGMLRCRQYDRAFIWKAALNLNYHQSYCMCFQHMIKQSNIISKSKRPICAEGILNIKNYQIVKRDKWPVARYVAISRLSFKSIDYCNL